MSQNQPEQEESQPIGQMKVSNTMYYIQFFVGLLVIIVGYIILKAINDFVGWWATLLIILAIAVHIARKL